MKSYKLPVTRLNNVEAVREMMRRFHWKRWFETKRKWHREQAEALESKRLNGKE